MAKMRIDKLLSNIGIGTRKEVKKFIKEGLVLVNGNTVKDAGLIVDTESDEILFDGEKINYKEFIYIMINKPKGVISATYDEVEKTVIDLLPQELKARNPFPVGRLDKDTEGLLLITNDGDLAHQLLSPKKNVIKKYYAEILGFVNESDIKAFNEGIILEDGYKTLPANLEILFSSSDVSKVYVYIREGKYHQIKRMFESVGKKVIYLKRLAMGSLTLDENLKPGEWRELSEEELSFLKKSI
ncbi:MULTISPECIES: pseudouridine synthase [Thermoanaerobacter]|uniref:Pseudouridine synthase n=4 Tax=Thermoanaerobacter TaxID=1754 RepID=B0K7Z1_THEP3|nr:MULTISPECIES: pseudouridine synthase [Thermoanaerobacter]ABY95811.1 pseudouridine synthase [Thermoanaerobacter pseudethanolicus ATCC 33223]ADV80741.1 pseudouridine synthase [Thermoanaerobacter brockii subsp. finnii Ako-1]AEM77579.1 pseudouridine synthase Rsu [Thermoanaerobacter wiegelii Rt8.B1]EMT38093.1 pseudouridine synthase [Thermoanaerobacter thermohydrosulfuricus WC1]HBW59200.1 rRNA pseudouridine synthase [Thermoanaerobacter sp.]